MEMSCFGDLMSQTVTFLEHHDVEVPFLFFPQLPREKNITIISEEAELWFGMTSSSVGGRKKGGKEGKLEIRLSLVGKELGGSSCVILTVGCCRCCVGCLAPFGVAVAAPAWGSAHGHHLGSLCPSSCTCSHRVPSPRPWLPRVCARGVTEGEAVP